MMRTPKFLPFLIVGLVLAGSIGANAYLYHRVGVLKNDPTIQARQQAKATVEKVSALMVLPTGEEPTVATVSDPAKLKDQVFFANAQKDDVVLLYTSAKKAVLYRPIENKIVEVAPITTNDQAAAPAPAPAKAEAVKTTADSTAKTTADTKTDTKKAE